MKVLALGALWIPYIRDNWMEAIRHVLGGDVVSVNVGPLLAAREEYGGQREGFHCAYVYRILREQAFDYLFFYHDWIFEEFPDEFFEKVRRKGIRTAAFHPDDEPEHWYQRNAKYDHHFDLVASHSTAGVARRLEAGWGERVMYLPWGYNPRLFRRLEGVEKRYDVVFVGKHKVFDGKEGVYIEDGAHRQEQLVHLAECCERRGWRFRVFGHGWDDHPVIKKYAGGVPSQEDLVRIFNETRVVFNPAWSADGDPRAVQTKLRHFEVPGCGAFQLTNENQELAELFKRDEEIVFFNGIDEAVDKIQRYIEDDGTRESIALAGHARAMAEHTLDRRVTALFERMRKIYPLRTSLPTAALPRVRQFRVRDDVEARELLETLRTDPSIVAGSDWVHFLAGDFLDVRTDYALLVPYMDRATSSILGVRSYFDVEGTARNPLQRARLEHQGRILPETFDVNAFEQDIAGYCHNSFVNITEDGRTLLLCNFIAPTARATELLSAFLSGRTAAIRELAPIHTGCVVTEVLIRSVEPARGPNMIKDIEYVRRLRVLLKRFAALGYRIVLYGARGMGEVVLRLVDEVPEIRLVGVIDRDLSVLEFGGVPVLRPEALRECAPDVIILSAAASGASIHASIAHMEATSCILPLYDLHHPVWRVFIPWVEEQIRVGGI